MFHCLGILLISFVQLLSANNEIEILFAGDAMQHGPQISSAHQSDGRYDYSKCFSLVNKDISTADYAVVNLECPLAGKPYGGYPNFSAPDEYAKELKRVGFDLFMTSNNHAMDKGDAGLLSTINRLNSLNIPHVGTYCNAAARDSLSPYIADVKDVKIAFLSYTYGTNSGSEKGIVIVDRIKRTLMQEDIEKARGKGANMVCVYLHWGIEYELLPSDFQRSIADFLVEQGVDFIIGSHPHVIQPYELRDNPYHKKSLIVYSLGNFISNQTTTNSRGGAMVKAYIQKTDSSCSVTNATYKLVFVQKPTKKHNYYQLIPAYRPDLINSISRSQYHGFLRNSRAIFRKYNINVAEE